MSRLPEGSDLSPEWADVRAVSDMARATVVIVMQRNIGKGRSWRKQEIAEHLRHARAHIPSHPLFEVSSKEDIEKALCRLAMALTLMEKEDEQA